MSRYIDKDSAIDLSISVLCGGGNEEMAVLVEDINSAPTIEIIRCGECKYDRTWMCPWRNTQVPRYPSANDFCSYGERNGSEIPNSCEDLQDWKDRMWAEAIVTEPQTEVVMPKKCKGCDSASKIIEAYSRGFMDGADAVKDMTQTFTADGIVFAKMDEPQTERSEK